LLFVSLQTSGADNGLTEKRHISRKVDSTHTHTHTHTYREKEGYTEITTDAAHCLVKFRIERLESSSGRNSNAAETRKLQCIMFTDFNDDNQKT